MIVSVWSQVQKHFVPVSMPAERISYGSLISTVVSIKNNIAVSIKSLLVSRGGFNTIPSFRIPACPFFSFQSLQASVIRNLALFFGPFKGLKFCIWSVMSIFSSVILACCYLSFNGSVLGR